MSTANFFLIVVAAVGWVLTASMYFDSRKRPFVVCELNELSDFELPAAFYEKIATIPISVRIGNIGNRAAENTILTLATKTRIVSHQVDDGETNPAIAVRGEQAPPYELVVQLEGKLNPNDGLEILLYCAKPDRPHESVVSAKKLTASEGRTRIIDRAYRKSTQDLEAGVSVASTVLKTLGVRLPF